jgi:hypothetical protein
MVSAIIDISEEANYVLNLIKAKYSLKDKSSAIDKLAQEYSHDVLNLELKPGYIKKLKKIQKEKTIRAGNVSDYFSSMR